MKRKTYRHFATIALLLCIGIVMPKERVNAFGLSTVSVDRFTMLGEIRAFEIMQKEAEQLLTEISIKSSNAMPSRAVQGDTVTVSFSAREEIENISALIDGQVATIVKKAELQYEAVITVDELNPTIGLAKFMLSFKSVNKQEEYQINEVTDESSVFLSDITNIVDVLNDDIEYTGAADQTSEFMLWEIGALFDHDAETVSELSTNESGDDAYVIFDFNEKGIALSRIEVLSSQEEGYESMEGLTAFGSNDGTKWVEITDESATSAKSWQALNVSDDQAYRYIKIKNSMSGTANMAELRLFDQKERKSRTTAPKVTSAKIFSDNYDVTRAYQGNTIGLSFALEKVSDVSTAELEVVINGEKAYLASMGEGTYYSDSVVQETNTTIGYAEFAIYYKTVSGNKILLTDKTTNGSVIFVSDETNLIDLLKEDVDFIDVTGKQNADVMQQEAGKLLDNNVHSYSELDDPGVDKESGVIFEFKNEPVQLARVELLGRQDDYYSRIEGTMIYGSNDKKNWTNLTMSGAKNTKLWQVLTINDSSEYRYIKVANKNEWYSNMAEIRFYNSKERSHTAKLPVITEVSVSSNNEEPSVAYPGDTFTITFRTEEEVEYSELVLQAMVIGQMPQVKRVGDRTYAVESTICSSMYSGELVFDIFYCNLAGKQMRLTSETTDGSTLFITNEENLIDVFNEDIGFIDSSNRSSEETLENVKKLFDRDKSTYSEFTLDKRGEDAYLIFDFKEADISLSRIEFLARQDEMYTRIDETMVYGSVDGLSWNELSFYSTEAKKEWQVLHLYNNNEYRYIKIQNHNAWYGNIAELRLYRQVDRVDTEESGEPNVSLGLGSIQNPTSTTSYAEQWTGSKLYFGQKGSDGILWRVLDQDNDGGVFLFADDLVEDMYKYNHGFKNTTWGVCSLRSYLNGYLYIGSEETYDAGTVLDYRENGFIKKYFKDKESEVIKETLTQTKDASNGFPGGPNVINQIFLLSIQELESAKYGFVNKQTRANPEGALTKTWWWTRSPATRSKAYATFVDSAGSINKVGQNVGYGYNDGKGVRPAFNLDRSAVLFTSSASVSKVSYMNFGSEESQVVTDSEGNDTWKVTLQGTEESLEVTTKDRTEIPKNHTATIEIQHKKGSTLSGAAQVSAMLVDEEDNILYYGKINDDLDATSSTVIIPKTLGLGTYTLKVFAETINGNHATDFATAFSEITLEVVKPVPVHEILDLPDGMIVKGEANLGGMVQPENASFQTIQYVIKDAGTLDAYIKENVLYVGESSTGGSIIITAIVQNGLLEGKHFTQDFMVQIEAKLPPHVPVDDIQALPEHVMAGEKLTLNPVVQPSTATNSEITWSVTDAGTTMAKVEGNIFLAEKAGTAVIKATIKDGLSIGMDYSQEFTITVEKVILPTMTPMPTEAPTATPSPTVKPTEAPTATPSPTLRPTEAPTATPSPTIRPTEVPTATPSPTEMPTAIPSPTMRPTEAPVATPSPTLRPTEVPTATPSPTVRPTEAPTSTPSPTMRPTGVPMATSSPTEAPMSTPTPTVSPTVTPTETPMSSPTDITKPEKTKSPNVSVDHDDTAAPEVGMELEEMPTNKKAWWWIMPVILSMFGIDRMYRNRKKQDNK